MTMIDKAEALRIVMEECYKDREMKLATRIEERLAALPAHGVGVTWHPFDTAPRDGSRFLAQGGGLDAIDICSYNARVGFWDCGAVTLDDTDHEPEGYNRPAQWTPLAALGPALAPTDAAHVNETPKSEHDAGNVLAAAQAREAALREAAKALHDWQDDLIASQMPETAITVGMAADVVLALPTKEART